MVLAIAPTTEETEKFRRTFAKLHCFVYCASYANMVRVAEKYKPNALIIQVPEVTDLIKKKLGRIRTLLPDIGVIILSDTDVSELEPDLKYSLRAQKRTIQSQALYFTEEKPYKSYHWGSYIISGLVMIPFYQTIYLGGELAHFTPEEVFLLRYLAEIYPRRASVQELGALCFTYGKKTPRATVASRISRINKKAESLIFEPIITFKSEEGYGIDF